jgi:hypothetical protein
MIGYILTVLLIAGLARGNAPVSNVTQSSTSHLAIGASDFGIGTKVNAAQAEIAFVPTFETKFAPLQ